MTTEDKMFAIEDNRDAADVMMCYLEGRVIMDEVVDKGCKQIEDITIDEIKKMKVVDKGNRPVFTIDSWDWGALEENGYSFEV